MFTRLREWLIRKLGGIAMRDLRDICREMEREEQKERVAAFARALDVQILGTREFLDRRNMAQQYKQDSAEVA